MTAFRFVLQIVLWTMFCGMLIFNVPLSIVPLALMLEVRSWHSWRAYKAEQTRALGRHDLKMFGIVVAAIALLVAVSHLLPAPVMDFVVAHEKEILAVVWGAGLVRQTSEYLRERAAPEAFAQATGLESNEGKPGSG